MLSGSDNIPGIDTGSITNRAIIVSAAHSETRTYHVQWNLSNTDTLGTKIIVLISEVSLFQGENNMYVYHVGTRSIVLINQVVLILEVSFKRGWFHCIQRRAGVKAMSFTLTIL